MITEFTDPTEIKRLILEEQIKPARVRAFFKKQGILLLMSRTNDVADAAFTFFLGSEDLCRLQELIHAEHNYQKSTILIIEPSDKQQTQDDLNDTIVQEMNRYKTVYSNGNRLESLIRREGGGSTAVFSYDKHIPGKNKFMSVVSKTIEVNIDKIPNSSSMLVDIRRSDPSDTKEIMKFFSSINKPISDEQQLFCINHVSLNSLSQINKIEFYDRLSKNKFKSWKLETITGITVKKDLCEDDNDEEDNADIDQSGALAGISSAILRGNGLRTNEFVQSCIKSNFMITSMKFKYSSLSESISMVIDINFTNSDIRIDIEKSYETGDDGKEILCPLPPSIQNEVVKEFQKIAYRLYRDLIEDQKEKTR